jgi:hypothetical protein
MSNESAVVSFPRTSQIEHAEKLRESGLSKAEYARRNGLSRSQVYALPKEPILKPRGNFVAVKAADSQPGTPSCNHTRIRLIVEGNLAIEAETSADPLWLARLVNAVKGVR